MNQKEREEFEKNSEFRRNMEADERAWKRLIGYVKLACFISINAILAGVYAIQQTGAFIYTHYKPLRDWIDAIIAAASKNP